MRRPPPGQVKFAMLITSRDNHLVRKVRQLLADSKARRNEGMFAVEGARLCADAARSHIKIRYGLYTAGAAAVYGPYLEELRAACPDVYEITDSIAKAIGDTATPQGLFCVCNLLDNRTGLDTIIKNLSPGIGCLALENVQDPANLGAVIRTAEALGLNGLILSSGCCDLYNPKVLRGSMGGVFRLPIAVVGDMADAVRELQDGGTDCWACVVDRDAEPLTRAAFGPNCVCLIGNEGGGLRPETAAACAHRVTIPMGGRAESLNASMAAGIVMWEMARANREN